MFSVRIQEIAVSQAGLAELIQQSTELANGLYPPETNDLLELDDLALDHVFLIGAFIKKTLQEAVQETPQQTLIGIGSVVEKHHDCRYGEMKRLFVRSEYRGHGIGKQLIHALEEHMLSKGITIARLETGIYQPEAIDLYSKLGFQTRSIFGDYQSNPYSVYMEKQLTK